jgi:hypothetical protein
MNKQLLFAALAGAFATVAAAQSTDSGLMNQDSAKAAIESSSDNSVNTQTTATQDEANTAVANKAAGPTNADRASALAPTMEIQYWQAGAGAAKGAENAAKSAQLPPQAVPLNTPEAQRALEHEATQ